MVMSMLSAGHAGQRQLAIQVHSRQVTRSWAALAAVSDVPPPPLLCGASGRGMGWRRRQVEQVMTPHGVFIYGNRASSCFVATIIKTG
nr:hypothetical protein CFP56_21725 [Quercus suber]